MTFFKFPAKLPFILQNEFRRNQHFFLQTLQIKRVEIVSLFSQKAANFATTSKYI